MSPFLDQFARGVVRPLDRLRRGSRTRTVLPVVERLLAADPETQAEHTLRRLRAVVAAARAVPFHRDRLAAAGIGDPSRMTLADFARLPRLTREDLRREGANLKRPGSGPLRASATGGTTSTPVPFWIDPDAYWRRRACTLAFDAWFGRGPDDRIAYLWGAAHDFPGAETARFRLRQLLLEGSRFYPASPLDAATMDAMADDLEAFGPALLQAYPTPMALFAEHLIGRGRVLRLPAVSCTAEPLLPAQRALGERAFGTVPYQWYGSREMGRVATECDAHEGMHVNVYGVYVETVPDPAIPGTNRLVITDLWNTGFPLLRYDTDDLASFLDGPCSCGRLLPRLGEVAGRVADCFVTADGRRVPGIALHRVLTDPLQAKELQIVQTAVGRFTVNVVPGPEFASGFGADFAQRLAKYLGDTPEVTVETVDHIAREPSGKLRFCKIDFRPDDA